jgi:hypothetical protein
MAHQSTAYAFPQRLLIAIGFALSELIDAIR